MSKIEWTDVTWNPLAGCTRASRGCDHCYAAVMALRLEAMAHADVRAGREIGHKAKYIGTARKNAAGHVAFVGTVNLDYEALTEPFAWRKPRRVFVNSMSDLFHKDVPYDFVARAFAVMAMTPEHTYQVLTKRPERMAEVVTRLYSRNAMDILLSIAGNWWDGVPDRKIITDHVCAPLPNVWLGTSVEDQAAADERIPHLLRVPARVRFLSCEPLLGPLDLGRYLVCERCDGDGQIFVTRQTGRRSFIGGHMPCPGCKGTVWRRDIRWIIAGGESGVGGRPMHPAWARSLQEQAQTAGVAFFFKQWGEYVPDSCVDPSLLCAPQLLRAHFGTVGSDGSYVDSAYSALFPIPDPECVYRVGKARAGRLLDGREWSEYPELTEAAHGH